MKVVVLGAGYAGLTLARKLQSDLPEDAELVVVEQTGQHLVQHELHRVIRRPSLAEDITVPLSEVLDCEVLEARVESVDPEANRVELAVGERDADGDGLADENGFDYDYAAVCLGAETAFYDLPGVEEYGTPLKRLAHAETIRRDFLDALPDGRVVVGGAGLSGVQVAGELAAFAGEEDASPEIVLLEQFAHVAPAFPRNFQSAVRAELEKRGVKVRTGATVERATATKIELEDRSVEYDQFVWTGGIRGPDVFDGERPAVNSTLRLGDGTFVVGDAARVVDEDGEAVPASAQAAVREARVAAKNVLRLVERAERGEREDGGATGEFEPRLDPFTFDSPGWLVSVGDGAVAQLGPAVLTGRPAKALKTTVGAGYLSSVGAVRNAAELVGEEIGWGN